MELLTQLLHAFWAQDFETLANPSMIGMLYFVLFMILFLENGLLLPPSCLATVCWCWSACFVPKGQCISADHLLLTIAASLGCWVISRDDGWGIRASCKTGFRIFRRITTSGRITFSINGLSALLIGRFIAFVRTLLPTIAGLSGLSSARFQFFNWMSGLLWVLILTTLGYAWQNAGVHEI
jgi:membrane protein DedA with SNARE-associated domain